MYNGLEDFAYQSFSTFGCEKSDETGMENPLSRITLNPAVNHGKPTIRNLRYPVEEILSYLAAGDSVDDILNEFKDLERQDILACLAYAVEVSKMKGHQVIV